MSANSRARLYPLGMVIAFTAVGLLTLQLNAATNQKLTHLLELPSPVIYAEADMEPVPYGSVVAGEFADVDLPDEEKLRKYPLPQATGKRYSIELANFRQQQAATAALVKYSAIDPDVYLAHLSKAGHESYQIRMGLYTQASHANYVLLDIQSLFPAGARVIPVK